MDLKFTQNRAVINGSMYELLEYDEYRDQKGTWSSSTAVTFDDNGEKIVLPYRGEYNGNTSIPGIYNAGPIDFIVEPSEEDRRKYIPDQIITMNEKTSIKEVLENEKTLSRLKEPWITNPDNITTFPVQESDEPAMKCLKTAVNKKKIDIDKYAGRFGDNFPNDKRQMKNNNVTLKIIQRFCDYLDMEAILTIRDKGQNVPNPIGEQISISLSNDTFLKDYNSSTNNIDDNEEDDESSDF
jgi:hypothetical protein